MRSALVWSEGLKSCELERLCCMAESDCEGGGVQGVLEKVLKKKKPKLVRGWPQWKVLFHIKEECSVYME